MRSSLERSSALRIYRQYVDVLGLGYEVSSQNRLTMPGYDGVLDLRYATAMTGQAAS
jgi:hypothetical protein